MTERRNAGRIVVRALALGVFAVLVYALSTTAIEDFAWNPVHAGVLFVLGLVGGAAWGSHQALEGWRNLEIILVATLGLVFGLLFMVWAVIWNLAEGLNALFPGAQDILYGFWFIAAIVGAYIIRKPGAAITAETLAAAAEFLTGSEWGLTLILSGLAQGGMAELVFALTGYRRYDLATLMAAGAAAGIGSMVVDYLFWYSDKSLGILAIMLVLRLISGAVLSGWLGKVIADGLYQAGALNAFAIARDRA